MADSDLPLPPGARRIALAGQAPDDKLIVIGIETPRPTLREAARLSSRNVARVVLGAILGCRPDAVALRSDPGQPLRLARPAAPIGLSLSHESGLSLLAINLQGAVGVDLMRVEDQFDWTSDWQPVARDYFGPDLSMAIGNAPAARRQALFAEQWSALEASLKCQGLSLSEWDAARDRDLRRCRTIALELPANMVGTLALLDPVQ